MSQYSKYLDDQGFIDWIFHPTAENSLYWESFLLENPEEEETICHLKNILQSLKTKDHSLTDSEKKEILEKILINIEQPKKPTKLRRLPLKFGRYAALLVIAFGLGSYFILEWDTKEDFSFENIRTTSIDSLTETQLILNSGEQLLISNNKSTVKYTRSGEVIVNDNDTLSTPKTAERATSLNQLIVPFGKRSKISLSDGSVVHLNAGSRFVFPEKFNGNDRKVFLDGEAFFEVVSKVDQPFIVKTLEKEYEIEVVGTKFNVSAYASDKHILAVLTEGEVHINKAINSFYSKKTKLKPGELATWDKADKGITVATVNTDDYTLWMEGILQFESQSVYDVAQKIERFYNIQINLEETLANEIRISGKLDLANNVEKTLANFAVVSALKLDKINDKEYGMK